MGVGTLAIGLDKAFNVHQMQALSKVFENPFATGFSFSLFAIMLGFGIGKVYLEFTNDESKEFMLS